jgi:hypothetical protein
VNSGSSFSEFRSSLPLPLSSCREPLQVVSGRQDKNTLDLLAKIRPKVADISGNEMSCFPFNSGKDDRSILIGNTPTLERNPEGGRPAGNPETGLSPVPRRRASDAMQKTQAISGRRAGWPGASAIGQCSLNLSVKPVDSKGSVTFRPALKPAG